MPSLLEAESSTSKLLKGISFQECVPNRLDGAKLGLVDPRVVRHDPAIQEGQRPHLMEFFLGIGV